jgi:hypothetical protein
VPGARALRAGSRYAHPSSSLDWRMDFPCSAARPGGHALALGSLAPDFGLRDPSGEVVRLSDYRGRPVVLVFYPLDWSPGCSQQLDLYEQEIEEFRSRGAELPAISVDSLYSHGAWAAVRGLTFPLLAGLPPEGRGGARLLRLARAGRILRARAVRRRPRWCDRAPPTSRPTCTTIRTSTNCSTPSTSSRRSRLTGEDRMAAPRQRAHFLQCQDTKSRASADLVLCRRDLGGGARVAEVDLRLVLVLDDVVLPLRGARLGAERAAGCCRGVRVAYVA